MVQAKPTIVELDMKDLDEILRRLEARELDAEDCETIKTVMVAYVHLLQVLGDKDTTLRRLRQMLFGAKTEKTAAVIAGLNTGENVSTETEAAAALPAAGATADAKAPAEIPAENDSQAPGEAPGRAPGHGRNGADDYTGAEKIEVRHESLQPGDPCPRCETGTLYDMRRPGVLVRLVGQAPVGATIYYLQKLRCGLCGVVLRSPSSGTYLPSSGCSFTKLTADLSWRASTSGLVGSSTSGGWNRTRHWAGQSRICCGTVRN
jgi:ribosomal protein L12E/L44/L45/RPP1/RPP2